MNSRRLEVVGAALAALADPEDEPVHQAGNHTAHDRSHPVHLPTINIYYRYNETKDNESEWKTGAGER